MPDLREDLVEQVLRLKEQKADAEEEKSPPTAKLTRKERRKGWAESQHVTCEVCNRAVLQKNYSIHKARYCRTEQCPYCPLKFSVTEFSRHQLACRKGPGMICPVCNKEFSKKGNLNKHQKKHSN